MVDGRHFVDRHGAREYTGVDDLTAWNGDAWDDYPALLKKATPRHIRFVLSLVPTSRGTDEAPSRLMERHKWVKYEHPGGIMHLVPDLPIYSGSMCA